MFFKLCSKNNFKINNICGLQILKLQKKGNPLNHEYYLLAEDIDNLNLEKNRNDFIKIIVNIYTIYDTKYLMKLIESKNGIDYCRSLFELIYNKAINITDLSFENFPK